MMPDLRFRDEAWRVELAAEARRMRSLWATVVLNAVNEAAAEVAKCRRDGLSERAAREIDAFRTWIRGRDGWTVLQMAGIDRDPRVTEALISKVVAGDTTFMFGGAHRRASRGAGIDE